MYGSDNVSKPLVAIAIIIFVVVIIAFAFCMSGRIPTANTNNNYLREFGDFTEYSHVTYVDDSCDGYGVSYTQYTVYNNKTMVVYLYTTSKYGVTIVPYYTRNMFGELTVFVYDVEEDTIRPLEPYVEYYDDDGELVVAG